MIFKLESRDKVNTHKVADKVNEIVDEIEELRNKIEELKPKGDKDGS